MQISHFQLLLNKEEYKLIYDLYDSQKYNFEYFIYSNLVHNPLYDKLSTISDRNLSLIDSHHKLISESGFAPT